MEHEIRDQELDAFGPALDRAREAAGLALQMEAQRQRVQVLEHADGDQAQRAFLDLGEDPVPDLVGGERDDADDSVTQNDCDRHGYRSVGRHRQRIDHNLVEERHQHVGDLGDAHERKRDQYAQSQRAIGLGPEQLEHPAHDAHLVAPTELGIGLFVGRTAYSALNSWAQLRQARARRSRQKRSSDFRGYIVSELAAATVNRPSAASLGPNRRDGPRRNCRKSGSLCLLKSEHDFGECISGDAMLREHRHEACFGDRLARSAVEMRARGDHRRHAAEPSRCWPRRRSRPRAREDHRRNSPGVSKTRSLSGPWMRRSPPAFTQVWTATACAQNFDRAIHSVALGDTAEIDPQGPAKAHAMVWLEADVTPCRLRGRARAASGCSKHAKSDELRSNGDVEATVGDAGTSLQRA